MSLHASTPEQKSLIEGAPNHSPRVRKALLLVGAALVSLLTVTAVYAAKEMNKPGGKDWANAREKDWQAEYDGHYPVAQDFRIGRDPRMMNGHGHFSHEGEHFVIVGPYPENWNTNWHSSDDVYLEYKQGYYLINRRHPGSPLAVMAVR